MEDPKQTNPAPEPKDSGNFRARHADEHAGHSGVYIGSHEDKPRGWTKKGIALFLLVLIFVAVYFAHIYHWLTIDQTLWRWWPGVALVLAILALPRGNAFVLGMVALVAIGVVVSLLFFGGWNISTGHADVTPITVPTETGVERASVTLSTGATSVSIAGGSAFILGGEFRSNTATLDVSSTVSEGMRNIILTTQGKNGLALFGNKLNNLTLQLHPALLYDIALHAGAASLDLDLRTVHAENIDIETGASQTILRLGDTLPAVSLTFRAQASTVDIRVPPTLGVTLQVHGELSSRSLADFTAVDGTTYQSKNYAQTTAHATLDLSLGASSLTVRTEAP